MSSDTLITIKDRIIQHIHFLKERMEPDFGLLNAMHANGIIDWRYKMAVESRNSSRERNYKLLNYILDRDQCDELVKALTDSDQMHIANYLTSNGVYSDDFGENWPLAEKQISILNINHRSFVDLLDLTDLLGLLYSSKIINSMQKESISSKPTSHEKNNALLGILRRRSVCDYKQTIKCLHESKQSHIATVLECCGVIVLVHASLDGENVTETENEISTAIANMIINDRSSDEADQIQAAGRILGLAMVKVIAAKKGQSVVLYIYCKTIEDLQQLHDYLISGQLKDSVELWFNSLLIRSQKTKVAALTTDFEEFQKMRTYFKDEEIRINSLKRNYSEESEVTDNLQKKQRMPLATEEDCQPSTTTLNELPLELLDAILMSSLLHRMLHSSTHQRDEDIIRTLTSVDFCWFQRITKRRFKKRSWKQLKDFYGKTRKRFAIIRNNRNYLLANIKLDSTLIDSLLSVNCLTKEQIHYIQRQRSNRLRNIELLRVMRSFDVTKFSIFVTCLRKANQKTVARIMENGGGLQYVLCLKAHIFRSRTFGRRDVLTPALVQAKSLA